MKRIALLLFLMAHHCRFLRRTSPAMVQAFRSGISQRRHCCIRPDFSSRTFFYNRYSISSIPNTILQSRSSTTASQTDDVTQLPPYLVGLNPNQVEAVTQPSQTITRVIAGPGSGKTRVLTCRIVHLLQQDTRIRVLGVTFTKKAAGEMQKRVEALLREQDALYRDPYSEMDHSIQTDDLTGDPLYSQAAPPRDLNRVSLGTFHSICSKILRWNGDLLSTLPSVAFDMQYALNTTQLDQNFAIIDQSDQVRIIRDLLSARKGKIPDEIKPMVILTTIAQIKLQLAQGQNPFSTGGRDNGKPASFVTKLALELYPKYREELLATNCLDFDDLIYMTRELLMHYPDIRVKLHQRWSHILVDEFQDTSRIQMDLVKLLTSGSLLVVGDADQSIYSWRGAHASSLMDFEEELEGHPSGKMKTVYLMENYRSTSNIVKAAQKVISSSNENSKSQSAADKIRQEMKPKRGSGPSPRVVACADAKAEADFIIDIIKERLGSGDYASTNDVALIYRTNAQSRALEEACVKASLPYVIFGSATSFYKRQEIKDTLCFLRWMNNGYDKSSMLRAMVTPKRGIGDVALNEFDAFCSESQIQWKDVSSDPGPSPLDVLLSLSGPTKFDEKMTFNPTGILCSRSLKALSAFSQQIRSVYDEAKQKTMEQLLSTLASELNLFEHFDKISKSKSEFLERKANFEELQNAARKYSGDGPALSKPKNATIDGDINTPLGNFLDDVALVTDVLDAAKDSENDAFVVKLMTIHASKGMEFDTVFLVGNEDGTLPTSQAIQEGEGSVQLEEEKRLCYVAMTRAKTELLMTWRKEVPVFTKEGIRTVKKNRSRFLDVLVKKAGSGSDAPKGENDEGKSAKKTTGTSHVFRKSSAPDPVTLGVARRQYSTHQSARPQETVSRRPSSDGKSRKAVNTSLRSRKSLYDFDARLSDTSSSNREPIAIRKPLYNITATLPGTNQFSSYKSVTTSKSITADLDRSSRSKQPGTNDLNRAPSGYAPIASRTPPPRSSSTDQRADDKVSASSRGRSSSRSNERSMNAPYGASPLYSKTVSSFSPPNSKPAEKEIEPKTIDSTWFYPVGSVVRHKTFGRGVVIPPGQSPDAKLNVLVHFDTGEKKEFCATGNEITLSLT